MAKKQEYKEFLEGLIEKTWEESHPTENAMLQAHFAHFSKSEGFARSVGKILQQTAHEIAFLVARRFPKWDKAKAFSFAADGVIRTACNKILDLAFKKVLITVQYGVKNGWEAAEQKNDAFVGAIFDLSKLPAAKRAVYMGRHEAALQAFEARKVDGLNLSERVWNLKEPFKAELEAAIDASIEDGQSAQRLSQEVRSCLQEPNKLFRRVRDKYGNLTLSKAAKLYHPGQGVYRSSYMNAMRLARTEINLAYRTADFDRWQQLDFVVGIQVNLSNNHTTKNPKGKGRVHLHDICDELAGKYPKGFKFTGWHPQCRCFATPILKPLEELNEERGQLAEAADGQKYIKFPASNEVTEPPKNFKDYIKANEERIAGWKSKPYYIKDNLDYIEDIAGKRSPILK